MEIVPEDELGAHRSSGSTGSYMGEETLHE
jgi:hypothetical protein